MLKYGNQVRVLACTWSTSACTLSTGVCGRTPWPRLKMCPGRPATRRRMSSAAASNRSRGPHSRTGSRFPWTACDAPIVCHASSMCWRQSTPITSPPASTRSGRIAVAPTPKWISALRRHGDRRRCASCGGARTRDSRRARARRPTSRRSGSLGACADLRLHVAGHRIGEEPAEPMPRRWLRVHERLGPEVVLDGPPSMAYAANVNGAPPKPMSGARSFSAARSRRIVSRTSAEVVRFERPQAIDVARQPHRVLDAGSLTLDEVELQPHRREGQKQIGKKDRGVEVDDFEGLERDGDGELRIRAEFEERVFFAERSILRKVAAGLSHQPPAWRRPAAAGTPEGTGRTRRDDCRARVRRSSRYIGLNRIDAPSERSSIVTASARK